MQKLKYIYCIVLSLCFSLLSGCSSNTRSADTLYQNADIFLELKRRNFIYDLELALKDGKLTIEETRNLYNKYETYITENTTIENYEDFVRALNGGSIYIRSPLSQAFYEIKGLFHPQFTHQDCTCTTELTGYGKYVSDIPFAGSATVVLDGASCRTTQHDCLTTRLELRSAICGEIGLTESLCFQSCSQYRHHPIEMAACFTAHAAECVLAVACLANLVTTDVKNITASTTLTCERDNPGVGSEVDVISVSAEVCPL